MNFNLGEVLSRAGQITWKHKNLWIAGIVLTLLGILPTLIVLPFSSSLVSFTNPSFTNPSELNRQMPVLLLVNALTILLSILLIPVYVFGMAIPALGTVQAEQGSERLNIGELLKGILPYFWRLLGVLLLVWLGMFVVLVGWMVCNLAVSVVTLGFGSLCMLPILIPLLLLVFALMEQGMAAVLVDNLGVIGALQRAWELIKKNLGTMALVGIIIYLAAMIVGMIISVPMMIPMFGFMSDIVQSAGSQPDPQVFEKMFRNMTWWMLAFSPLYAFVQGIVLTFMQSAWTLTYMRLTRSQSNTPVILEANA